MLARDIVDRIRYRELQHIKMLYPGWGVPLSAEVLRNSDYYSSDKGSGPHPICPNPDCTLIPVRTQGKLWDCKCGLSSRLLMGKLIVWDTDYQDIDVNTISRKEAIVAQKDRAYQLNIRVEIP
jgi:hypothetical protein